MAKSVDKIVKVLNKIVTDLENCYAANEQLSYELQGRADVAVREADRATRIMENLKKIVDS